MRFFYGYWQEYLLAKNCSDKIDALFNDVEHPISDKNIIGVHCRRGDFIKMKRHKNTMLLAKNILSVG